MFANKNETDLANDMVALEDTLPKCEVLLRSMLGSNSGQNATLLKNYCLSHKDDELVVDMVIYLWYRGWEFNLEEFCPKERCAVEAHKYIFEEPDRCRNFDLAMTLVKYCLINYMYEDMNAISLLAFMLKHGIGIPANPYLAADWLEIVMRSNNDSDKTRCVAFVYFEGRLAYEGLAGVTVQNEREGRKLLAAARRDNLDANFFCAAEYFDRTNGIQTSRNRRLPWWARLFNGGICESTMFIEQEVNLYRASHVPVRVEDIGVSCALARCVLGFVDERTLTMLKVEDEKGIDYEEFGETRREIKNERTHWIGCTYLFGEKHIYNQEKALLYLTKAGEAGYCPAWRVLVYGYDQGLLGRRKGDAVKWINKLSKVGEAYGLEMKGDYYLKGYYHSTHSMNDAIVCYSLAARKGRINAMYDLAVGFLFGKDEWTLDLDKGAYWLGQCISLPRKHPIINTLMGVCLCVGRGIRKNDCEGRKFLKRAKNAGCDVARYILSGRYPLPMALESTVEWLEGKYSSYDMDRRDKIDTKDSK